jgi:hypothetical protein
MLASNGLLRVQPPSYSDWGDMAIKLQDESFRAEYVLSKPFLFKFNTSIFTSRAYDPGRDIVTLSRRLD